MEESSLSKPANIKEETKRFIAYNEKAYTNYCQDLFMNLSQSIDSAFDDAWQGIPTVQRPHIHRFVEKQNRRLVENQWMHLPFHCSSQLIRFKEWANNVFGVRFEYQNMYRLDQPYYIYFQKDKSKLSLYSYF